MVEGSAHLDNPSLSKRQALTEEEKLKVEDIIHSLPIERN